MDTDLPSGGEYYDHVDNDLGTQALWVALAEKGYAEANALGFVTTNNEYQGCYSALNYGDPSWALQAITGKSASDYSINPTNIATDWNAGQPHRALYAQYAGQFLHRGDHCYAVVGYNASSGDPFEVFNPWGTNSSGWAGPRRHRQEIYGLFLRTPRSSRRTSIGRASAPGRPTRMTSPVRPRSSSGQPLSTMPGPRRLPSSKAATATARPSATPARPR